MTKIDSSEAVETTGTETVHCSCGAYVAPVGQGQCPKCGRFLPANEVALVHGGRRMQLGRGSPMDEARRVAIRDAVIADLGGADECSAVLIELAGDFASAVSLRDLAWAHIASVGPLTKAGRRRAATDLYLQASQRAERLASRIGTDRKPARVPTLQEFLQERAIDQPEVAEAASKSKVTP